MYEGRLSMVAVKLRKLVNRVHRGTVYYRWVLNLPPKTVRALGWVDGQKLEVSSEGNILSLRPVRPAPPPRPGASASRVAEYAIERSGGSPASAWGAAIAASTARRRR